MTSLAAFTKGEDSDGHFVALTAQALTPKNNLSASVIFFHVFAQGMNATGDPRNVGCEVQTVARQVPF